MSDEIKPMSLSVFAWLYRCEAEYEPASPESTHWWHVFEPLDTKAGPSAHPNFGLDGRMSFYDRSGNVKIDDHIQAHDINHGFPFLLLLDDGRWREVLSGKAVHRKGRWFMQWLVADNTRSARMMNVGFETYRE